VNQYYNGHMKHHTVQLALMLILGIAIGAVGAYLWTPKAQTTSEEAQDLLAPEATTTENMSQSTASNAKTEIGPLEVKRATANVHARVSVSDQPAGNSVEVTGLSLSSAGWVAIYDTRDGVPGWILGAKRFLPGDKEGVVPLLRQTVPGETYFAILHGDDGDLLFDKRKDVALTGEDAVVVTFRAK